MGTDGPHRSPSILLVDDDPDVRSVLCEILKLEGYDVVSASDGRQGLRMLQENPVSLVITDVLMPELDGLEVIRTIRKVNPMVPIIAMSGGGKRDLDFLIEAKEFGATKVVNKPFEIDELVELVKNVLGSTSSDGA